MNNWVTWICPLRNPSEVDETSFAQKSKMNLPISTDGLGRAHHLFCLVLLGFNINNYV